MPVYAVTYEYAPDTARLDEVRPEHRAFLAGLHEQGSLIVSGPLPAAGAAPGGALLILEASDDDAATALLAEDPFRRENLIAERTVREWLPVIGSLGR
jgi:uncharacterized protein YciI